MNIFDLQAKISLDASAFYTGVEQAQGAFQGLGGTVGAGAVALGNVVAGAVTTAASDLVDFGKSAINTGMTFDTAMSNVKAISGATGEEFDSLRNKAKEMGSTTKFTASEAAEAFSYMAMAGWKAGDMMAGIEGIMNLAAASGESLASTSDIVTDALTAFGLSAADSGHFADVLAAAASNANTNVGMMGDTFKYVAPVAGALGYTVEDVATAIGTMANSGIKGSQAGTALRSALSHLLKPSDEAYKVLQKLDLVKMSDGVEEVSYDLEKLDPLLNKVAKAQDAYDKAVEKYGENSEQAAAKSQKLFEANLKVQKEKETQEFLARRYNSALVDSSGATLSLSETVETLRGAFSGLSESQQAEYAATLFGQEAMSGMLAIINSSELDYNSLASAIGGASDVMGGMGAAASMAETQLDNLGGKITIFQSAMDGLKTAIYDTFSGTLASGVENLTTVIDTLRTGFEDGGLSGAVSALGNLIGDTFSGMVESVTSVEGPLSGLAGIFEGSLGSAVSTFTGHIAEFVATVTSVSGDVLSSLATGVSNFLGAFDREEVAGIIGTIADGAADLFGAFMSVQSDAIKDTGNAVKVFVDSFDNEGAADAMTSIASKASELFSAFSSAVADRVRAIGDRFSGFGTKIAELASKFPVDFGILGEAISGLIGTLTDFASKVEEVTRPIREFFGTAFSTIFQGAVGVVVGAAGGIVNALASIVTFVNGSLRGLGALISGDFTGAAEAVKSAWSGIAGFFKGIWDAIKGAFSGAKSAFEGIGRNIVEGLKSGISGAWSSFLSWIGEKFSGITSFVMGIFGEHSPSKVFAGIGANLVLGLKNGWSSEMNGLVRTVGTDMASLTSVANLDFEKSAIGMSSAAGISSIAAAGMGAGASRQPVEVNLVLDGEVAAKALFDPLRGVAYQKGRAAELYA